MAERLDLELVRRGLCATREKARGEILSGNVLVDDAVADKPGARVRPEQAVRLRAEPLRYVSRGGLKLEAALDAWPIEPSGRVCVDLGASTGGFTDCLLQRGAARVHAIDVGYGQLAWKLRQDPRVVVRERTNARHLEGLDEPATLLVGDLSFISLALILPAARRLVVEGADAIVLVKPQFEVGRADVGKGGLVRDAEARARAVAGVEEAAGACGWVVRGRMESPVPGARAGNVEWLVWLVAGGVVS